MLRKIIQFNLLYTFHSDASSQPLSLVSRNALCSLLREETGDRRICQASEPLEEYRGPYLHGATVFWKDDILEIWHSQDLLFFFPGEN